MWYQIREALLDFKTWIFFALSFIGSMPAGGLSNFQTLILQSLGAKKSPIHATLLNLPGFSIQIVSLVIGGVISTKFKNISLYIMSLSVVSSVIVCGSYPLASRVQ